MKVKIIHFVGFGLMRLDHKLNNNILASNHNKTKLFSLKLILSKLRGIHPSPRDPKDFT